MLLLTAALLRCVASECNIILTARDGIVSVSKNSLLTEERVKLEVGSQFAAAVKALNALKVSGNVTQLGAVHTHGPGGSKAHVEEEVAMLPREARPLIRTSCRSLRFQPSTIDRHYLFIQPFAFIKVRSLHVYRRDAHPVILPGKGNLKKRKEGFQQKCQGLRCPGGSL